MAELFEGQPAEVEAGPSEAAAPPAAPDSEGAPAGAGLGQPVGKKWAKMFDSPEKLEDAYGHIYKAYHAKCHELQQTSQALDGLTQMLGGAAGAPPAMPGIPGMPGFGANRQPMAARGAGPAGFDPVGELVSAVQRARTEAQQARQLGEKFVLTSLENQVRDYFSRHPELGEGNGDFERFAREVSSWLGPVDADALQRLHDAMDKAYRVVNYPEAVREAGRRQEQQDREAERFVVEGGGAGSMSVPRNQTRETSFRALVQRLKREAGLE